MGVGPGSGGEGVGGAREQGWGEAVGVVWRLSYLGRLLLPLESTPTL